MGKPQPSPIAFQDNLLPFLVLLTLAFDLRGEHTIPLLLSAGGINCSSSRKADVPPETAL